MALLLAEPLRRSSAMLQEDEPVLAHAAQHGGYIYWGWLHKVRSRKEFSAKFPRGCCRISPKNSQFTPKLFKALAWQNREVGVVGQRLAGASIRCAAIRGQVLDYSLVR